MNLIIIGAGGHGHVCKEIAEQMVNSKGERVFKKISFLDDHSKEAIGTVDELKNYGRSYQAVFVAIGNPNIREQISLEAKKLGYELPCLYHSSTYIADTAQIGKGSILMPLSVVQSNVTIGESNIISAGAVIDHDARVGDYCHVNAGAVVSSMSLVPEKTKVDYLTVWK